METKIYTTDVSILENKNIFLCLYNLVSPERKSKTDRMVFDKDKRLSLGAGVLLEAALADQGVNDMTFTTKQNKKPCLAHTDNISFNISHSGTKVMCSVSDKDIGCDVEQITDIDMEIAKRFFFAGEYKALMNCTEKGERNDLFFRYWTLKESFMKVTGLGFRLELDDFCIILDEGDISVRQSVDARKYYFREYSMNDGYRYAVCSAEKPDLPEEMILFDFIRYINDNSI